MLNIALYGEVDKRPLVYGLFKLLQHFGDVLFVTDECHYKRLLEDRTESGYFQNITVCVSPDVTPDTVFDFIKRVPEEFDAIIWDTKEYIPDNLTVTFACESYRDAFIDDDILDCFPEPKSIVKFMYDKKKDTDIHNIRMTVDIFRYVEKVEAFKMLDAFKFKEISTIFEKELSTHLGVDSKAIRKLLEKGWEA